MPKGQIEILEFDTDLNTGTTELLFCSYLSRSDIVYYVRKREDILFC